jgi:hypothetical protein
MMVVVGKFTKLIEVAPVTTQNSIATIKFINSIVFCFGVPHNIITDNGTNFTSKEFKNYCESMASGLTLPLLHTRRGTDKLKPTG